ncbi:MAG TPA: hypothetical protein VIT91_14580 [Chthoniobacterales bacterium]
MAPSNRREAIFLDDEDHEFFFGTQTPEPNLVTGMKWLQNT